MLPVVARSILSKIAPDVIVKAENNRAAALRQLAVRDTYGALRQSVWDRDDDIEENWERSASLGDMLEAALKGDYIEDVIEDLRLGREPPAPFAEKHYADRGQRCPDACCTKGRWQCLGLSMSYCH